MYFFYFNNQYDLELMLSVTIFFVITFQYIYSVYSALFVVVGFLHWIQMINKNKGFRGNNASM